jgi:hypothetical protein
MKTKIQIIYVVLGNISYIHHSFIIENNKIFIYFYSIFICILQIFRVIEKKIKKTYNEYYFNNKKLLLLNLRIKNSHIVMRLMFILFIFIILWYVKKKASITYETYFIY